MAYLEVTLAETETCRIAGGKAPHMISISNEAAFSNHLEKNTEHNVVSGGEKVPEVQDWDLRFCHSHMHLSTRESRIVRMILSATTIKNEVINDQSAMKLYMVNVPSR